MSYGCLHVAADGHCQAVCVTLIKLGIKLIARWAMKPPSRAGFFEMYSKFAFAVIAATMSCTAQTAFAASKAASYLVDEQIKKTCPRGGQFKASAVIERDLTNDGSSDLILDFSGLICTGASNGLNDECGAAHCLIRFYVRRGGLLVFVEELMSIGAKVGSGNPPKIGLVSFEYKEHSVRWNGKGFR